MISSGPVAASANLDAGLLARVNAFVDAAKAAAADGITWAEFGDLMLGLIRLVVTTLDTVSLITGPQKKALAMEAVARLFDAVADKAVPAGVYPLWLLVRPAVRALVLALASGALEQVLPMVRV